MRERADLAGDTHFWVVAGLLRDTLADPFTPLRSLRDSGVNTAQFGGPRFRRGVTRQTAGDSLFELPARGAFRQPWRYR
ncbi:hypothetical protein [Rhodococcus opacus]|uniref:Uncharacterized protein n=1 Tax=Rhodococcus opacus TaxID=37919 RepID=A0AAX3YSD2_RHOOP|nr:hypothetical protein [Rhodococcus opacus]WLF51389.1 hypothetical protein Q5707_37585 [Rhodococcus opacus]